jgi:hypothetical protein
MVGIPANSHTVARSCLETSASGVRLQLQLRQYPDLRGRWAPVQNHDLRVICQVAQVAEPVDHQARAVPAVAQPGAQQRLLPARCHSSSSSSSSRHSSPGRRPALRLCYKSQQRGGGGRAMALQRALIGWGRRCCKRAAAAACWGGRLHRPLRLGRQQRRPPNRQCWAPGAGGAPEAGAAVGASRGQPAAAWQGARLLT